MVCASSSGAPLPPNGGVATSPHPLSDLRSLVAPLTPASSCGGGPLYIWGVPSPTLQQALHEGHVLLLMGCPSPPPLGQGSPPPSLSCRPCERSACFCLGGNPSPLSPGCMMWDHAAWSGFPLSPLAAHGKRVLLGEGSPPLLHPLAARWGGVLPCGGVLLYPLAANS